MPNFTQVHPEFEQAVLVNGQGGTRAGFGRRRMGFHRIVVGNQGHQARVGDPLQQARIAAFQHRAALVQQFAIRLLVHFQQHFRKARVQAHHVALFNADMVFFHDVHELLIVDVDALAPHMGVQVNHHGTALHAALGHFVDAQGFGLRGGLAGNFGEVKNAGAFAAGWAHHVDACAKTVVVHRLGLAVAVGIEHRAYMGQAVPLRAVLQVHDDQVIADHIGAAGVVTPQLVIQIGLAVAQGWSQHRRQATGVQHVATGHIERQAEVEGQAFFHFGNALTHFVGRQQVHPAVLVVGSKVAPG